MKRRFSRPVNIGGVVVGGGASIVVQSMTKTDTRDVRATRRQIRELAEAGCRLVRLAVPDREAALALAKIKKKSPLPIIADIHFDYRLAILSLEAGADALRLNPGTMGNRERVAQIVKMAKERQVPIRVGVNAGSLPPDLEGPLPQRLAQAALREVEFLEGLDFELIKVSAKAFDVPTTVEANRLLAERMPYPLHLGITEAGPPAAGIVRSAIGMGILLYEGIGDTIRVSLTTPDPREEVRAGSEILKALDLEKGPVLVSCPTCGRCEVANLPEIARKVEEMLSGIDRPLKIAVMGCVVNGPGECREADVGIACGKGKGALFLKGQVIRTVEEGELLRALSSELLRLAR
ncbi:MAG TPA: flavodoxin-dependent (E)-4-hydroxy-3-methylbut-2-enyl-diphosphate synthase [Dehalococcoidia bacterium]|nr:flavodoxin-dependent (E)-4-hydroxy-3-methylbut-2-enyl-diphosphate synthase [Dehalococcoidia bacterium]